MHVVPFGAVGFEHAPVAGLHVPATWQASLAVHVTPTHAFPVSYWMLSKFVSQPFPLWTVTVVHVADQLSVSVLTSPEFTLKFRVGLPAQVIMTLFEAVPPLYATKLMGRRGWRNVKLAELIPGPLNDVLLVVNPPHGPEVNQFPVPQSISAAG